MTTVTSNEIPLDVRDYEVYDKDGPRLLRGRLIVDKSWTPDVAFTSGHTRWTDLLLYRVYDELSENMYALQVIAQSIVYHRENSPCRKGVHKHVGLLRRDAAQYESWAVCSDCNPDDLENLKDTDLVAAEIPKPSLETFRSAEAVVKALQVVGPEKTSNLKAKVLLEAAGVDEDIRWAMLQNRRV